jgi:hypothetical protein
MEVKLSALLYPKEDFWYSFVWGLVDSKAVVWIEILGKLKKYPMISSVLFCGN